jgi:cell pole-organizing protein PopZ
MTEQAAQEPTMEEILASIRRIISEDEPPADAEAPEAHAAPAPVALAEPEPEPEDVLELTERAPEPEALETLGDLDVLPAAPEPAPVAAAPVFASPDPVEEPPLVSAPTAEATSSAFGHLSRSIRMPTDGATLEGVVRELLRPLLQSWLDENLPGIVQNAVAEEVERLSRRRV